MRTYKCLLILLAFLILTAVPGRSQEAAKPLTNEQLIVMAREIMGAARYCSLITSDSAGIISVRTIDPFPPDENMVVWFSTNPRTRKVAQILHNRNVTLHYFDRKAEAYVAFWGTARLVDDPREKAKRFKEEWKAFYPDRDKSYLLIEVTPTRLELVNVSKGVLGDPQTWLPPTVEFRKKNKTSTQR